MSETRFCPFGSNSPAPRPKIQKNPKVDLRFDHLCNTGHMGKSARGGFRHGHGTKRDRTDASAKSRFSAGDTTAGSDFSGPHPFGRGSERLLSETSRMRQTKRKLSFAPRPWHGLRSWNDARRHTSRAESRACHKMSHIVKHNKGCFQSKQLLRSHGWPIENANRGRPSRDSRSRRVASRFDPDLI